ncbi:glycosyltransferase [Algoriphagus sp. AGSA1]|uniref:glycosyltransferase n=1 Tax=Algoriphagus sp. AGSA1 TaxID=2907213 RepID=UPI001F4325F4|nr:glycosyltransferase [Algoriphagus sp. AGSA1]MCE7055573.1 glycosyltransferase [Algoriphagus sp. AGSA1]
MKKVLFISWDSDKTNYLENLFFPIFSGLQNRGGITISIFQFSWAKSVEVDRISFLASKLGLDYNHFPISRKAPAILASLSAVFSNRSFLINYLQSHQIQVIIPRSTMPALFLLTVLKKVKGMGCEIVFDADGLPIQERLDLGNLTKGGIVHRILTGIEHRILLESSKVLVRTRHSIDWHTTRYTNLDVQKFFLVGNGRDIRKFHFSAERRNEIREQLNLSEELVLIHSGSLGPGYALDVLFSILRGIKERGISFKMVFLTRDPGYLIPEIPYDIKSQVIVLEVAFDQVPDYLMAGDVGVSLRKPGPGTKGILPIKLGEYMMCGLPVLVSRGIGDMDLLLSDEDSCLIIDNQSVNFNDLVQWFLSISRLDKAKIAKVGSTLFSLEKTLDNYQKALL